MNEAKRAARDAVRWRDWSQETFALARKLDKPVLLDIGAVWCHWCHVMEDTVYDDPEVASKVNELYIPIKVDTDRRPEVNERYNQGGWPTTAFLTPEGDILYGATYVPKEQFKQLLANIANFYRTNRAAIAGRIQELRAQQAAQALPPERASKERLSAGIVQDIIASVGEYYDPRDGGFGPAGQQKFPQPEVIDFLLFRHAATRDRSHLRMVEKTLTAQAMGGLNDHIGGGFHRYAVQPDWRIPHFEKMLKDQAGHIRNYLDAYQATGNDFYRNVALQTLEYVERNLTDAEGGFYGSQDADVGLDDDGSYYTWSKGDLRAILTPKEYDVMVPWFGVDDDRNAMGEIPQSTVLGPQGLPARMADAPTVKHVLNLTFTLAEIATQLEEPVEAVATVRDRGLARMRQARLRRQTPIVDKHIFADWNAMMVSSCLKAWGVLGEEKFRLLALKTLDRLIATLWLADAGMGHYVENGGVKAQGLLADQVYVVRALLDAYAGTGERRYLATGRRIMEAVLATFHDDVSGGFWDIPQNEQGIGNLAFRRKSLELNAVAADDLLRLRWMLGKPAYGDLLERTLLAFAATYDRMGFLASIYGQAVANCVNHPVKMTVVGPLAAEKTRAFLRACSRLYEPRKLVVPLDSRDDAEIIADLGYPDDGHPKVYICIGQTCAPPVSEPEKIADVLRSLAAKCVP